MLFLPPHSVISLRPIRSRSFYPVHVQVLTKKKKEKKETKHAKGQKTQFKKIEPVPEAGSAMTGVLERSDQKFKITMIKMLRAVMEIGDNMQKHGHN